MRFISHRPLPRSRHIIYALALFAIACIAALALLHTGTTASADEGWTIDNFHADIAIQRDASLQISEQIDVDFGAQQKHGIFRDIPVEYAYDDKHHRVYRLDVMSITDAIGTKWPYETGRQGGNEHIRIGDPKKTVSGKQSYRILYRVRDAMNGFPDHDELFWNVNGGNWPVPTKQASATVTIEGGSGIERAQCYEGPQGSTEPCAAKLADGKIDFTAARSFRSDEQMTIVAGVRKGVVTDPTPHLERLPRTFPEYFSTAPAILVLAVVGSIGALTFAHTIIEARKGLYTESATNEWFASDPEKTRSYWSSAGVLVAIAGGGLAYVLGRYFGWALIGIPLVLAGLLLFASSRWMPKRTAKGSEMLRRVLGFRLYVDTAETRRQEFNEQANIFAEYLPYAIVFGSVHKWANAFRDIDTKQATAGWYSGGAGGNWSPVIFSDH